MYRVEDKYTCTEGDMLILQSKLNTVLRPDNNQADANGYCITSVYFDDYWNSNLYDAEQGYRLRMKYRIRIYNHSFSVIKLEIKYKRDNKILKKSRTISMDQMKKFLREERVEDRYLTLEDPITLFNLAISEKKLSPKVIVEYDRKAYVYEPGNVRITLDRNIRASGSIEDFSEGRMPCFDYLRGEDQILEVKYDEFLPGFLAGLLESGDMNQTSYSKYKLCREFIGGYKRCQ